MFYLGVSLFFFIFWIFHLKKKNPPAISLFISAAFIFPHTQRATGEYPIQSTEYYSVCMPWVHAPVKDCWCTYLFKHWVLFILLFISPLQARSQCLWVITFYTSYAQRLWIKSTANQKQTWNRGNMQQWREFCNIANVCKCNARSCFRELKSILKSCPQETFTGTPLYLLCRHTGIRTWKAAKLMWLITASFEPLPLIAAFLSNCDTLIIPFLSCRTWVALDPAWFGLPGSHPCWPKPRTDWKEPEKTEDETWRRTSNEKLILPKQLKEHKEKGNFNDCVLEMKTTICLLLRRWWRWRIGGFSVHVWEALNSLQVLQQFFPQETTSLRTTDS